MTEPISGEKLRDLVFQKIKTYYEDGICVSMYTQENTPLPGILILYRGNRKRCGIDFRDDRITIDPLDEDKVSLVWESHQSIKTRVELAIKMLKKYAPSTAERCGSKICKDVLRHLHERVELLESLWLHERVSGLERRMASRL